VDVSKHASYGATWLEKVDWKGLPTSSFEQKQSNELQDIFGWPHHISINIVTKIMTILYKKNGQMDHIWCI